eukprot:gene5284-6421_t
MAVLSSAQIIETFEEYDYELDGGVATECVSLCKQYDHSAEDLFNSWEAYSLNRKLGTKMNKHHVEGFRDFIADAHRKKRSRESDTMPIGPIFYGKDDLEEEFDEQAARSALATPQSISNKKRVLGPMDAIRTPEIPGSSYQTPTPTWRSTPAADVASPDSAFAKRSQSRSVQATLNPELPKSGPESPASELKIDQLGAAVAPDARFMYDRLQDKVNSIEERILAFAAAVQEREGVAEFYPVQAASQDKVMVVGRVVCDSSEGRLNGASVMLEGSIKHSGGERVRLELRNLPSFSLFPGQIIAIEGNNPTGYCLVASRLISSIPAPMPRSLPADLPELMDTSSMLIAAGPFCSSEDVLYEPLAALVDYAIEHKVGALMLLGPFVDVEHPAMRSGALDVTFDELYQVAVLTKVQELCDAAGAQFKVVLQPSTRDAHTPMIYPQAALPLPGIASSSQLISISNPGLLQCNEMVIGSTSQDILKHLSGSEAFRSDTK